MPSVVVRLLGRPAIEIDGERVRGPRGRKAWAVLAYTLLSEGRVGRSRLAELIFADAADPLGALRWTLTELRRALGVGGALAGDPLALGLPASVEIDAVKLLSGALDPSLVGGELLEGVELETGGTFDAWLLVERRRLAGVCSAVLRDAALGRLASGRPLEAAALAARSLALDAFDESAHELLVRCLARAGDVGAARHHATECELLFRRELGRNPDPRVRRAADEAEPAGPPSGDRAAAVAQLEAGLAALAAGAAEPGVECLRMACAEARGCGDAAVLARALAELGSALVHAVRGRDEEGAALLVEALELAERTGQRAVAAEACRELGFVEVQAGRPRTAGHWLTRATSLATSDPERSALLGVRGMALSDRAHYPEAIALLGESATLAERCGQTRQCAWSLALAGRAHLLRGSLADARTVLERSLELTGAERWVAFQPLPEALRAEVALREGDHRLAEELLAHSFALSCKLSDPCWEAFSARATGLLHHAAGAHGLALEWVRDAGVRAARVSDGYAWVRAYCLDALAELAIAGDAPDAAAAVAELEELAARSDIREFMVRAALHRARLGDTGGLRHARELALAIDSPALRAAVTAL
jgi:DNA-binding SARP family transcriptional activator